MVKQYVGARYVPKFASPVDWTADTSYEALTIVTFNNASYTSKIQVPPTVGNPANNPKYWALTGNYNAQVEEYRQETEKATAALKNLSDNLKNAIKAYGTYSDFINDMSLEVGNVALVYEGVLAIYKITNTSDNTIKSVSVSNNLYGVLSFNENHTSPYINAGISANDAINFIFENYNTCYCDGEVSITNTIIIPNEKYLYFDSIKGNMNAPEIEVHRLCKVVGNNLTNTGNGANLRIGDSVNSNVVLNSTIDILNMASKGNNIVIGGQAGVQEIRVINGKYFSNSNNIVFDLSNSYVGEISFANIVLSQAVKDAQIYAFYIDATKNQCTGLKIFNVSAEGCNNFMFVTGTYDRGIEHLLISGLRVAEITNNGGKIFHIKNTTFVQGDVYADLFFPTSYVREGTANSSSGLNIYVHANLAINTDIYNNGIATYFELTGQGINIIRFNRTVGSSDGYIRARTFSVEHELTLQLPDNTYFEGLLILINNTSSAQVFHFTDHTYEIPSKNVCLFTYNKYMNASVTFMSASMLASTTTVF